MIGSMLAAEMSHSACHRPDACCAVRSEVNWLFRLLVNQWFWAGMWRRLQQHREILRTWLQGWSTTPQWSIPSNRMHQDESLQWL